MNELMYVVDCDGLPMLVSRAEYEQGKPTLDTYYRNGRKVGSYPPSQRYKPIRIRRESIASVAVRLRKHTRLDDRIARKFRKCKSLTFC